MPTESEFDQYNRKLDAPEIKRDPAPRYRLPFLDALPVCPTCIRVRHVIVYALAIYGLYSLIF